jgi:TPR repeat protein
MASAMPKEAHPRFDSGPRSPSAGAADTARGGRLPILILALTGCFAAFALLPRVRDNPRLFWTFAIVAAALLAWEVLLWTASRRRGRPLRIEYAPPLRSHYIQASVQLSIYLYWGWYWRELYAEAPLILAQLVFLYVFDALLSLSRGRSWRLGAGPWPIILSINVFIWFNDDWFVFQFVMVALCALGKEFVRWNRDGKNTHIFNPSAFGLTVASLALIVTGATKDYTWARDLASTIERPPHIYLWIFVAGLVVQYCFSVTLMTLSATAVLCLMNLAYTGSTDVYHFVTTNISAAVFLGLHLLMTDPATSPRTNAGRLLFGGLYGVGNWVLFDILRHFDAPELYTKLLVVPLLNLAVPLLDRVARAGVIGWLNGAWESVLKPKAMNLIHMGCWAVLFTTMLTTGFVEGPHAGYSIAFWKRALARAKPDALRNLILVSLSQANNGSGPANNEVGLILMEGNELVRQSNAKAARYFGIACAAGDPNGCANVAIQYLFLHERRSEEDLAQAFHQLERWADTNAGGLGCFLVGFAYESGRGRPRDLERAITFYRRCGPDNLYACKGLARLGLAGTVAALDLRGVAPILQKAADAGDAESCWYLSYMYLAGSGVGRDRPKAAALLARACALGSAQACEAQRLPVPPAFASPVISVPGWSTAFPAR